MTPDRPAPFSKAASHRFMNPMARPAPSHTPPAIDPALLHALLPGRPVARDRLPGAPAELDRRLAELAAHRCRLEGPDPVRLLPPAPLNVWQEYLDWRLAGPIVQVYRVLSSTQETARELLTRAGPRADGAVIVADRQRSGRGRLGRSWVAPAGSALLWTRVHRLGRGEAARLTLATCVALAETLEATAGLAPGRVRIKWPNDLYAHQRKLAGILTTTFTLGADRYALVGTGVNVGQQPGDFPGALARTATSLARLQAADRPAPDRLPLLAAALASTAGALETPDTALRRTWRRRSLLLGRRVRLRHRGEPITGEVVDLSITDGLQLRTGTGLLRTLPPEGTSLEILEDETGLTQ